MSEDGYPSSWDPTDGSDSHHSHHHHHNNNGYSRPHAGAAVSGESLQPSDVVPPTPTKSTSPPRSSVESPSRASGSRWRDSTMTPAAEPVQGPGASDSVTLVEASFDEEVLRKLCKLDCGVQLLMDRIKQSLASCREASVFFKKRAALEEEYGRNMQKLTKGTIEAYSMNDGKAGSFVGAWQASMRTHEVMAENRIRFAQRLNEMSEELATLAKEVDKNRKLTKDLAGRYERTVQEADAAMDKSKSRIDATAEELERLLVQKEGESLRDTGVQGRSPGVGGKRAIGKAVAKGGLLLKGRNPGNVIKQEEDIRARMSRESDVHRKNVNEAQAVRQEYFNFQYPRLLRALKECVDEIDLGTQYHLSRYAFLFESIVLSDATTLTPQPDDNASPGLKAIVESIDNRSDFNTFLTNYAFAHEGSAVRVRRDGPREEGYLPPIATPRHTANSPSASHGHMADKGRPTFGVDLAEQMVRDDVDVPPIMIKCCEAIEKYGLSSQGIYRIGGTVSKIAKLRERLDRDLDSVNLDAEEWASDVSNVTSVLKLWLRELPDPLLTMTLHNGFLDAARNENERLRHIRLHERVNDLPDPNYSTLKYFMGHLHKIVECEAQNAMSIQNLAIVFGPTLFGQGQPNPNGNGMADAPLQNKAIETILEHYTDIFVDEGES